MTKRQIWPLNGLNGAQRLNVLNHLNGFITNLVTLCLVSLIFVAGCNGGETPSSSAHWEAQRQRMVHEQLRGRDIDNPRVLDAMLAVPRHLFIPESERGRATATFPCRSVTARRSRSLISWHS